MSNPNQKHQPDFGLTHLATRLRQRGLNQDADLIQHLGREVEETRKPPGLFSRMGQAVRIRAQQQWSHLVGELRESKEVWGLIRTRIREKKPLTPEQTAKIRTQIMDIVRVVPASGLAVVNAALPVPGSGLFTPWLLLKLGLMPSRWREAHTLRSLEKEFDHLTALGALDEAQALKDIIHHLTQDTLHREEVEKECALLTHWDANKNGLWDAEERQAYQQAVHQMRGRRDKFSSSKRWYLQLRGQVFGPVHLAEIEDREPGLPLLVSFDGRSGWIAVDDLVSECEPQGLLHWHPTADDSDTTSPSL